MHSQEARDRAEVLRDEMVFKDRIIALLRQGPKTIPEMANALGSPSPEVVLWVMAMWRYGTLVEAGEADDDGYFQYSLKEDAK
jgi:hypothetical protein